MTTNKRKTTRRELLLGLIITLLGSPIIGSAIFLATIGIILSILVLSLTGEDIFFGVIATYATLLVVLYLLLWRVIRRARVLVERWQATRRENQRTMHLHTSANIAAESRLSDQTLQNPEDVEHTAETTEAEHLEESAASR